MKAARKTGNWVQQKPGEQVVAPIAVDVAACLRFIHRLERLQQEVDHMFLSHAGTVLYYEDLAFDYASALDPVCALLGVAPEPVQPRTYRQSSLPLDQAIENFDDLKNRLEKTRWRSFLD